jgi:hypothetical protein
MTLFEDFFSKLVIIYLRVWIHMEKWQTAEDFYRDILEIECVNGAGDLENECIEINVTKNCDLKGFLLGVMPKLHRWQSPSHIETAIWLPVLDLKKGNELLIWTKNGIDTDIDNTDRWQLFMGHNEALWGRGNSPILFEIRRYVAAITDKDGIPISVPCESFDAHEENDAARRV